MDDFKTIARHDRKRELLGQYAACALCHETEIRKLRAVKLNGPDGLPIESVLCAKCHVQLQGKPSTEKHHPAGRANSSFTVAIPANDHAVLTDAQHDWPRATWRNPDGSPLLAMAAALRGWLDVLRLIIENTIDWMPAKLENLDEMLRLKLGNEWWLVLGFEWMRAT